MEKKIGKNVSSGAEKVERVEFAAENVDSSSPAPAKTKTAKTVKKTPAKATAKKKERAAAAKRVEKAKAQAQKKEEKLQKRAEYKQRKLEKKAELKKKKLEKRALIAKKRAERKQSRIDRRAALKEKRIERRAERIARREMLKNESKAEREKRIAREKKERIALRRQRQAAQEKAREDKLKAREAAHARKAADKKHRREQRTERKRDRKGFGGWLAAVISLGTACLALGAVVTAGAFRMNEMTLSSENGYRSALYEMVSVSEGLDDSLDKLRVASGADEQRRLLTDIVVDSAVMESALERIPVDAAAGTDISDFVNRTGAYARMLLSRLAQGKTLTEGQIKTIEYLYEINSTLYGKLNEIATTMTEKDLRAFLEGGGSLMEKFGEIGRGTHKEPEDTVDAPFSGQGNVGENKLAQYGEITSARGEELAREYLSAYHVRGAEFTGETVAPDLTAYNYVLTDENGAEIFVQIAKNGGGLVFFDTYEECSQKNFDLEACDGLAREFLSSLGMDGLEAVWLSDGGMVANLTYVGTRDGVRIYPEMVRVRVCEERGRVVGIDARAYLLNGGGEYGAEAELTAGEARGMLSKELEVSATHRAVIPAEGGERLCYEFFCTYGGEEFIVYVDANTGEEVNLFRVRNSAQGSYLE